MKNNALRVIGHYGQRIWLDNLSRTLLREGQLQRLISSGIAGVTSNPSIFLKAISDSPYYTAQLDAVKADRGLSPERRYEALAIPDIQGACDLFKPLYEQSGGDDGYVSLEVSPALAHDTAGTVVAGLRLKSAIGRPNLLIKVPATTAGIAAIEELIAAGCSVNVTLMFSLQHVRNVANAYLTGAERRLANGQSVKSLKSVSSVFLSRVDTHVDRALEGIGGPAVQLQGKTAIALAKLAYQEYKALFGGPRYTPLAAAGLRPQSLLWASTGAKNPAYSDLLYVEPLIGPDTVNTVPDATLAALMDHGKVANTLEDGVAEAQAHWQAISGLGIDMSCVGEQLQKEGLRLFQEAFEQLLSKMA